MKSFLLAGVLLICGFISPTTIINEGAYHTQKGEVDLHFDLMVGKMKANTNQASSSLDIKSEAVIFNMKVATFEFDNSIIEQQFKQVYMEADKYPQTSFVGKIRKGINFKSRAVQHVDVEGTLAMHGISKKRTIPALVTIMNDNKIHVKSEFTVLASEHDINIPVSFFANGKDEIRVVLDAVYEKK